MKFIKNKDLPYSAQTQSHIEEEEVPKIKTPKILHPHFSCADGNNNKNAFAF